MADQKTLILEAEKSLELGPVAIAELIDTSYWTLRGWKNGQGKMPPATQKFLKLLMELKKDGKLDLYMGRLVKTDRKAEAS